MREQDHATGFPSIALPYGSDEASGKRDERQSHALAVLADERPAHPLGEVLANLGIGVAEYEYACRAASFNGTHLAGELIAAGLVDEARLADVVADVLQLPRRCAGHVPQTVAEIGRQAGSRRILRTVEAFPRVLIAPRLEDLEAVAEFLTENPGLVEEIEVSSESEIETVRAEATREARSEAARLGLSRDRLDLSARLTVTGPQGFVAALALVAVLAAAFLAQRAALAMHVATLSLYLGCIGLRLAAALALLRDRPRSLTVEPGLDGQERLPAYSVLVALRNEDADVVEALVDALGALRWPRSKLQILMVCEEDDRNTVDTVRARIHGQPSFRLVEVPPSHPRTKPKALNFALPLATGEFVALFDAEDQPSPDQLLAAWQAFRAADAALACVQAPLVVTNGSKGWLAAHFAIEYAALFHGLLPWLARKGMPLPLGGTSNHFRRDALVAIGGWDSHNVTEDADLGVRLARNGYRTGTIASPTFEEAPQRWLDWRNQRTRWMKGYAQTWLTHMRRPSVLIRELGPRDFWTFQLLFAGMILSSVLNTFVLAFLLNDIGSVLVDGWPGRFQTSLILFDWAVLLTGFGVYAVLATLCCRRSGREGVLAELWTLPAYWLLISFATLRALNQLRRAPHFWEKTPHGEAARRPRPDGGKAMTYPIPGFGEATPATLR